MYRISKIFDVSGWSDFLMELEGDTGHVIVLDFCDVSRVDRKPAELLVRRLPKHVLLLNCPTGIKNMADSAGLREQVLEPVTPQNPCLPDRNRRDDSVPGGMV